MAEEEHGSKMFKCQPRKLLSIGDHSKLNGAHIFIEKGNAHVLSQSDKLLGLKSPTNQEDFIRVRAKAKYLGCCTRPDICTAVQLLASSTNNPLPGNCRTMKKVVERCHEMADIGIKFVPIEGNIVRLALFSDALLANLKGLKSQLVSFLYLLMTVEEQT